MWNRFSGTCGVIGTLLATDADIAIWEAGLTATLYSDIAFAAFGHFVVFN